MARRTQGRVRLRRASLTALLAVAALTLSACNESPEDDLAATSAEASASASEVAEQSSDDDDGTPDGGDGSTGNGDGSGDDGSSGDDGDDSDEGGDEGVEPETSYAVDPPGPF